MRTALLDYELPEALIAIRPPEARSGGRLLVLDGDRVSHRTLEELPELLPPGALLVLNDTRVLRARLVGQRPGGGRLELLLLRRSGEAGPVERWTALGKPAKRLRPGARLSFAELEASVLGRLPSGELELELRAPDTVAAALERVGKVPIPPYLRRDDEPLDADRYQTVFAREAGSVAAPTAGLHLTPELLARIRGRGVAVAELTLHVGPGTFRPVTAADLDQHEMHAEEIHVDERVARAVAEARTRGAPVVAVGTTVVRALESARDPSDPRLVRPLSTDTRLLIQPGHRFGVVDALLTNFHLPRSTLLALVAAFAGLEPTLAAYREAISQRYRFLSYGDAMWIPRRAAPEAAG